jgi:hypothetical protein
VYSVTRWWGDELDDPPEAEFDAILAELDRADKEHPDAILKHESEWAVSCYRDGQVVFENVAARPPNPRHMRGVSRADMAEMWRHLARGDFDWLNKKPWKPGYR